LQRRSVSGSSGNSQSHSLLWVLSSTTTDNDNTQQQGSCDEATVVYDASAGGVVKKANRVAFAEDLFCGIYDNNIECGILGMGTECGRIEIWAIPIFSPVLNLLDNGIEYPSPKLLHTLPANDTHFDT